MKKQLLIISMASLFLAAPVHAGLNANVDIVNIASPEFYRTNNAKAISGQQAARIVQNRYGGKVLKVSRSGSKSKPSYRVKLLKQNGHVISVNVDANSGRISGR